MGGAALSRAFTALGAACALVPALAMWGFTVDDALISVRYAHNLASGAGYRFDAAGPSTDGVTPLPWAFVLRPLAGGDPMATLVRAKVLGVVAWTLAGAVLGARVARLLREGDGDGEGDGEGDGDGEDEGDGEGEGDGERETAARRRDVALAAGAMAVMALAFPIGAWAASGMETGLVTALATLAAASLARPKQAAALAGVAAAFRPEMIAWTVVIATGAALARGREGRRGTRRPDRRRPDGGVALLLGLLPFVACVVVRLVAFGRPAPLAVLAKPSDLAHGAVYVAAASIVVLTPLLAFVPVALVRSRSRETAQARVLVVAFLAHALAVLVAGGDWMPYARLMVPVAPSLVLVAVALPRKTSSLWSIVRLALATALGVLLAVRAAPGGRGVQADRADLVTRARPALAGSKVVAALDVGWVSAATEACIVDLAGLTDPSIALLPGGHTSKRVDVAMLLDRGVDTVVVYSEARAVEARIVRSDLFADRFERGETLPLGSRGASYTLYHRRP